ncbi:50S ribosomal protein L4 [Patescibacteria group bacterium]|nr:50S ribosomal protein L4 [Patescibacteria group bacterium]
MLVDVFNQDGGKAGQTRLPKEIFEVPANSDLVHQAVVSQMANKRRVIAHTKDRGEVRGGGKKPWRQKGTGRARHGSSRSPIWRGGGITFGPTKERVFKKIIPKKMRRKALFMVLSAKAKENLIVVLEDLKVEQIKTKKMIEVIGNLKKGIKDFTGKSILIALSGVDKNVILAARNIPKVETIEARNLNCLDLLSFKYLLLSKEAIKVIKETFLDQKSTEILK